VKSINFGNNREDLARLIAKHFPIQIKSIDSIVTRIHEQYPTVDRSVISTVVASFFTVLRTELLDGKLINFVKYLPSMGIFVYERNNALVIKPKLKTPESLKAK